VSLIPCTSTVELPQALSRLFSRFYRIIRGSQESANGLGLGLYIERELASAHGGSLAGDPTVGSGATSTL
jgi:signal transduction histidine kinase